MNANIFLNNQAIKYPDLNWPRIHRKETQETTNKLILEMMKKSAKKIFVLDTNVILHDPRSIYTFQDNDIVLPLTVIEELDHFKKGESQLNFQARQFMRELDKLSGKNLFTKGVSLGEGRGLLFVEPVKEFSEQMKLSFQERTQDDRIIAVAEHLTKVNPTRTVVLISQDTNVRLKAKSLNVNAEDYEAAKIDITEIDKEIETFDEISDEAIAHLYEHISINEKEIKLKKKPVPNAYMVLKGTNTSVLARYDAATHSFVRVEKHKVYGITPRNAEQAFALDALMNPDIKLIALTGKAGTGKTLLALAAALEQRMDYQQILLARPIVPLANRDMGFLPGDVKEKMAPYMQPLFDNLNVIKHQFSITSREFMKIEEMQKTEKLVIEPLAYIRGRSLSQVFFIVDEAQNLTPHEIKTIITRAGEGTKIIFTGDIKQIDSPYLDSKSNGLSHLSDKMRGQVLFTHINLFHGERSKLAEIASDLL